jgi:5-(carboxyamino)imidazole ribonucleotide synthase
MLCLAAARLGYRTHVFGPEADSPAEQVAGQSTVAPYEDEAALAGNSPPCRGCGDLRVRECAGQRRRLPGLPIPPVRPGWRALEIAQDRCKEKAFFASIGAATPAWAMVNSLQPTSWRPSSGSRRPAVLKTARFGYDGKGQAKILDAARAEEEAWKAVGGHAAPPGDSAYAVLEAFVDFTHEISVIAARGADRNAWCVSSRRRTSTPTTSWPPPPCPRGSARRWRPRPWKSPPARPTALDLVGLLAVEMFVTPGGDVLCNEMAPRPHNSGHWTMNACGTDQFEQLIRAAAGLPLRDPARHADATMINLIGEDIHRLDSYLADPAAHLHLYGKHSGAQGPEDGAREPAAAEDAVESKSFDARGEMDRPDKPGEDNRVFIRLVR